MNLISHPPSVTKSNSEMKFVGIFMLFALFVISINANVGKPDDAVQAERKVHRNIQNFEKESSLENSVSLPRLRD